MNQLTSSARLAFAVVPLALVACGESAVTTGSGSAGAAGLLVATAGSNSTIATGGTSATTAGGAATALAGASAVPAAGGTAGATVLEPGSSPLGSGDHSPSSVTIRTIPTSDDCLNGSWDLAFNPRRPDELWIPSHFDDGVCIVSAVTGPSPKSERRLESSHQHFMAFPAALAFGGDETTFGIPGTFATANDSEGDGSPLDGQLWNGISLWSSDLGVFGIFKGPDGNSHLDMLHDSPAARGIAWEKDNIYWVFGAHFGDITRYDFVKDHERGNADHSDGRQWHYLDGQVKGAPGVPSHLAFDPSSGVLYIADSGNGRILELDTTSGTEAAERHTRPKDRVETEVDAAMLDATSSDLVTAGGQLKVPAGIELYKGRLFVSDWSTGVIYEVSLTGQILNWLDTGLGAEAVGGLAFGPDDKLYFASAKDNELRVVEP